MCRTKKKLLPTYTAAANVPVKQARFFTAVAYMLHKSKAAMRQTNTTAAPTSQRNLPLIGDDIKS
jgi:hypothetical protein